MTPAEVCEKLGIQPSTLRKYSLLFEKEQITFARNKNNSRNYTVMQFEAIEEAITLSQQTDITLEEAVRSASKQLKTEPVITPKEAVTPTAPQRHNGDITAVMLQEIESLKEELRKRDEAAEKRDQEMKEIQLMYAEAMENMQQSLNEVLARLPEPKEDGVNSNHHIKDDVVSSHTIERDVISTDTPQPEGTSLDNNEVASVKKKGFFSRFFK